eukprot:7837-Heterococcus_DN1.PRE.1
MCCRCAHRLQLIDAARKHYATLDARLGSSKEFFFGGRPRSLDALVFGHIAHAMTDAALVTVLPDYTNLMR